MTQAIHQRTESEMPDTLVRPLRVLFALPGLHRVNRGAEIAFESLAEEIAQMPGYEVTLIGSGFERDGRSYRFKHASSISRERFEKWPSVPFLRNECVYEELSFLPGFFRSYSPREYDVTVTCSYPYISWALRGRRSRGHRPAHVFVTQNGDWAPQVQSRKPRFFSNIDFKFFSCDGLVCTNCDYYDRNRERWFSTLIPNGVDPSVFSLGQANRPALGLPSGQPVVLMVSALIESKRVLEGIRSVASLSDVHLVVAGDGPLRHRVEALGHELMANRFERVTVPRETMPELYRAADVFLHMSQNEPFGNVYVEALATGLPIVCHDSAATRWIVEDHAILVDTSDEEEVCEAIRGSLHLKERPHIMSRRSLVERRFSWSKIAVEYCRFFGEVLECGAESKR